MRQERKLAIAALIGTAAFLLLTDPDLITEILQVIKVQRKPETNGQNTDSRTIS